MGFNLIYCTPMSGSYLGKFRKNGRFSGRIRPGWGNAARADTAGLGSIGLRCDLTSHIRHCSKNFLVGYHLNIW